MENLKNEIKNYIPFNEQEEKDREIILELLENEKDILTRDNKKCHFTVSAWIVDSSRKKVLMCYHNIYNSWAWLGGHADGEADLKRVIIKEIEEESGIKDIKFLSEDIFSLEILTVSGHIKKGKYVSSHLHLNLTYLLEADTNLKLSVKLDENSGLAWINTEDISVKSTEKWFIDNIYSKLTEKVKKYY